ncbi:hypothetical protein GW7_19517 [Heterocephalus glaber]|uniref:Uncharacterized protein n=1 Tax=Heterocephalus glaber TaxID=10181 RepID=G5C347_HETGA|nr:hypothetical protein GW7_19517 [Heterocephalus glaber]
MLATRDTGVMNPGCIQPRQVTTSPKEEVAGALTAVQPPPHLTVTAGTWAAQGDLFGPRLSRDEAWIPSPECQAAVSSAMKVHISVLLKGTDE